MNEIPKIKLRSVGQEVSRLGFGGGWIIGDEGVGENQAIKIVQKAFDSGISYFDTASSYGKGESETRIGKAIVSLRDKIFLATKVLSRKSNETRKELENSFSRLNTDFIDLVQIHAVNSKEVLESIFDSSGSLKVIEEFRKEGRVRFIGLTGHKNSEILIEAIQRFKFDTVMFPVNPGEKHFGGFEDLIKECQKRKIGSIGMKVLGEGEFTEPLEDYFSYALDYVDVVLVGIKTLDELEKAVEAMKNIKKFSEQEKRDLESRAEEIIINSKEPATFWWRK